MRGALLAFTILAALAVTAHAQIWIMSPANQMPGHKGGGGGACTPTGLIFNVACNSQYIPLIH